MLIKTVQTLSNQNDPDNFRRFMSIAMSDILKVLNGNLSLLDNTTGVFVDVTFKATNSTVEVAHRHKGLPTGYIPVSRSADIEIFDGNQGNTTQFLYVQASGPGTARLYVF